MSIVVRKVLETIARLATSIFLVEDEIIMISSSEAQMLYPCEYRMATSFIVKLENMDCLALYQPLGYLQELDKHLSWLRKRERELHV